MSTGTSTREKRMRRQSPPHAAAMKKFVKSYQNIIEALRDSDVQRDLEREFLRLYYNTDARKTLENPNFRKGLLAAFKKATDVVLFDTEQNSKLISDMYQVYKDVVGDLELYTYDDVHDLMLHLRPSSTLQLTAYKQLAAEEKKFVHTRLKGVMPLIDDTDGYLPIGVCNDRLRGHNSHNSLIKDMLPEKPSFWKALWNPTKKV